MRDIRPQPHPIPPRRTKGISAPPVFPSAYQSHQKVAVPQRGTASFRQASFSRPPAPRQSRRWPKRLVVVSIAIALLIGGLLYWVRAVQSYGEAGYQELALAAQSLKAGDFQTGIEALHRSNTLFTQGHQLLFGSEYLLPLLPDVAGIAKVRSGIALIDAGDHLTNGASTLAVLAETVLRELSQSTASVSLLDLFLRHESDLQAGNQEIQAGLASLRSVVTESLPLEKQPTFDRGEQLLTSLANALQLTTNHLDLLAELLGKNGPRLYLFLFQNNQELRPTGGFIGSYALLDMNAGKVRRFFVDGVFNPDGQLKENIIPPLPIQKISAGWSLHDSNWFPDFPTSAEKAMFFYEKTGGPTTDGVVALTPEVLARLLTVVGPVELLDYGITIDTENFLPLIQDEVETKYNKEDNAPKKILGDLAGAIIERLTSHPDPKTLIRLTETLGDLLNERHILVYARDKRIESLIDTAGWSGKILTTPYDYLSVIHTNINGYKSDGVTQDAISHTVELTDAGTIVDTVTITRTHMGGQTPYEWWNKVNADYMRVYVPLGSKLLEAKGMTRETNQPPLDYAALGFRHDLDVDQEEAAIRVDPESGTRIGEEFGKTVFGNWVYVSPGEAVTVTYRYELPFTYVLDAQSASIPLGVVYQKQPGTSNTSLTVSLRYPTTVRLIWQSPQNLVPYERMLNWTGDLNHTVFVGAMLQK